jgi:hypothetical protein
LNVSGDLVLGATTPRIYFPVNTVGPPTFTNRSVGTRLIIYPNVSSTQVDFAIGMDTNTIWYSTAQNSSIFLHKWYGGTTNVMTLDGTGNLGIFGTTDSSSSTTGALQVSGGVGIAKSLYVGLNAYSNNHINGYATIVTAAGTTTLTNSSAQQQYFTGSTTQTVVLPVTSTLTLGQTFTIVNNSSGVVTVQSSGANSIKAMAADSTLIVTCILTSGTTAASWNSSYTTDSGLPDLTSPGPIGSTTASTGAFTTISASDTTDSSSSVTGALIVAGGVGISKSLQVGTGITSTSLNTTVNSSTAQYHQLNNSNASSTMGTNWTSGSHTLTALVSNGVNTASLLSTGNGNFNIGCTDNKNLNFLVNNSTVIQLTTSGVLLSIGYLSLSGAAFTGNPTTNNGAQLYISSRTFTDSSTAISGTNSTFMAGTLLNSPTFASTNATTTLTNAATLYITGPASAGTNVTLTNQYSIYVNSGNSYFGSPIQLPSTAWVGLGLTNVSIIANSSGIGAYVSNSVSGDLVLRSAVNIRLGISTGTSVFDVLSGQAVVNPTTDSSSSTTGSLIVSGGVGIAKSLYIGSVTNIAYNGGTLGSQLRIANNNSEYLAFYSDSSLNYWIQPSTGNRNLTVQASGSGVFFCNSTSSFLNTTTIGTTINPSTSSGGSLNTAGDLVLGATNPRIYFPNNGSGPPTTTNRSAGTKLVLIGNTTASAVDYAIGIDNNTMWYSVASNNSSFFHKWYAGTTNIMTLDGTGNLGVFGTTTIVTTINPSTSSGGALNVGGDLVLGTNNPRIYFPISGGNAPTFTNRSIGTRLIIYPNIGAGSVDFAIGMGSSAIWHSIPSNLSNQFFQWYGGTTNIMTLDGTGNLTLVGTHTVSITTDSSSSTTGALVVSGGAGIAKKLTVGTGIAVTGATSSTSTVDVSGATSYTTTLNGNVTIGSGSSCLIFVTEYTQTGQSAIYMSAVNAISLVSNTNAIWVAPTTTPGSGTYSVNASAGVIKLYNNQNASATFRVMIFKLQ